MKNLTILVHLSLLNCQSSLLMKKKSHPKLKEETVQVGRGEVLMDCGLSILPTYFSHQNAVLDKPRNNVDVMDHFVHAGSGHSVDLKSIKKHVGFAQDAMEVDATESRRLNLIVADNSTKIACSVLPQVEPIFHGQETSSTGYIYDKRSTDANCVSDDLKEQNSEETYASLEKNIAKPHEQLLNYSYPSGKVEISTIKSEKRRRKLRSHHPAYRPFLCFLKSVHFKKKICKARGLVKPM